MKPKLKMLTLAAAGLTLSLVSADCSDPFTVSRSELKPGGVYVAYNLGCKVGCSAIARGDLIQKVDGKEVKSNDDLDATRIDDGKPHKLTVFRPSEKTAKELEIVADPDNSMPEFKDAPPFWTVGAEDLDMAPDWARRRLFGHAMPQLQLTNVDGGYITGRQFRGKRHMVIMFDWATQTDRLSGATFMQMFQKAKSDLENSGYALVFAQVPFASERERPPMNDTDLRNFFKENQLTKKEGGPLPAPPMYRLPNAQEENAARNVGMEGSFTVLEAIGKAPAILITDDDGIVRWHSAGLTPDPTAKIDNEAVYTMNAAILFALEIAAPKATK